jgi:biopolymer transport protein ExbD
MAFSSNIGNEGFTEPNVVPLVDVMLVLLIIFMVTAPLMAHKVVVDLPQANLETKPETVGVPITLAITSAGGVFWNDEAISLGVLEAQLAVEAQKKPQPQVNIRADRDTRYRLVNEVVKTAKNVGIAKVGFVTEPDRR